MASQTDLNLTEVETLSQREKWLVQRLQEFKDLYLDIEACHVALSAGPEIPSITIRPPSGDDPSIVAKYKEPLKESKREVALTIERHVHADRWQYVSVDRVHRTLANTYSDDIDEDYRIRDAVDATRRNREQPVQLTPTERAIVQYEEAQEEVKARLMLFERRQRIISGALGQMQEHFQEWYDLLSRRYVQGEKYVVYLTSTGMSEQTYRTERRNALKKFDRLAVGLR